MDARPPEEARDGLVRVTLSQVPEKTRLEVAHRVVRVEGLVGVPALEMLIAATDPRQDPEIYVLAAEARRVLGA